MGMGGKPPLLLIHRRPVTSPGALTAARMLRRMGAGDAMTNTPKRKVTEEEALAAVRTLIEWAGDDPDREGLLDTPARVARSYRELFAGYDIDPHEYLKRTFEEVGGYDELVVLRDIPVVSFCEH